MSIDDAGAFVVNVLKDSKFTFIIKGEDDKKPYIHEPDNEKGSTEMVCEAPGPRPPGLPSAARIRPGRPPGGVLTLADNPTVKLDYPNPVSVNLKTCAEICNNLFIKSADGIINHKN